MTDESTNSTRKRLQITGSREPSEHVDGAWWPRSKCLTDELPELLGAVYDRVGPVAAVAYRHDGWTTTAPELSYGGADTVRLVSFDSAEPPSVIVIGQNGHHLTLRVLSPETDQQDAQKMLESIPDRPVRTDRRSAAAARSVAEVARKLAEHEGRNDPKRDAEILEWCEAASEQFDDARIQTFVPILVEHIVNNRIHKEHHDEATASRQ